MRKPISLALLLILLISLTACGGAEPETRIFFIGNSYTATNNLPGMFDKLAKRGGHRVDVESHAPGGTRLGDHAANADLLERIDTGDWDIVVLQEQSVIPSHDDLRERESFGPARILNQHIVDSGAETWLYETWGRRDDVVSETGHEDYFAMQTALVQGYRAIRDEIGGAPIVPVGKAWRTTVREHPEIVLWAGDGSHPSTAGTYLAACVFYAQVFGESPEGLGYRAGLDAEIAAVLQGIAADEVLGGE